MESCGIHTISLMDSNVKFDKAGWKNKAISPLNPTKLSLFDTLVTE